MKRYRKKPVEVEAVEYVWKWGGQTNAHEIVQWIRDNFHHATAPNPNSNLGWLAIETLEGNMYASPGDYIIKGVQGEFYPCKPGIFKDTYEACDPE